MILTPDRRLRVFISSTLDLVDARAAASRAVTGLKLAPIMFEAGARPHPPRALYRAYVEQSDVFVAIYSSRYGWVAPDMEISGLEDEFDLSAGKPRLVYIQAGVEREPRLDGLLARVRDGGLSYRPFRTADELESLLEEDLVALLTERFHVDRDEAPASSRTPLSLPVPHSLLVGRDSELAEIATRLRTGGARLVTLVGPGGIGKTRLAIAASHEVAHDFDGGAFFVSLADLRQPDSVAGAIARVVDPSRSDVYPAVAAITEFLGDQRALLVLDNFEHVIEAATVVSELLSTCPELAILATSRAPLRVHGERELEVRPLEVPPTGVPADDVKEYSAVRLFIESARAIGRAIDLDEQGASAIIEICRQLDGVPLAIELAAAMTRTLTPELIVDRLRQGLTNLEGNLRDLPERHQRLRDTIAWSYELLDTPTKELFTQLGVFRGGFTLSAAEDVGAVDGDVLSTISSLVEQNLLRANLHDGPRFSMLEVVHQFARDLLAQSPSHDVVYERHARTFVALAETIGRPGGRGVRELDAMEQDLDNVRAAFAWLLDTGEADRVARAMWESWWFWWTRGYLLEGSTWVDRCLATPDLTPSSRAGALAARAILAIWVGEYERAVPAFLEASTVAEQTGDRRITAYADIGVGLVRGFSSIDEGVHLIRRGIDTLDEIGDAEGAATGLAASSWVQAITRQFEDDDAMLREALRRAEDVDSAIDVGIVLAALAQFEMHRGDPRTALGLLGLSLEHVAATRHVGVTILTLEVVAELGLAGAPASEAISILGATAAIREATGTRVPPQAEARLRALMDAGRERLGGAFAPALERGSSMSFNQAVDLGRRVLGQLGSTTESVGAPELDTRQTR